MAMVAIQAPGSHPRRHRRPRRHGRGSRRSCGHPRSTTLEPGVRTLRPAMAVTLTVLCLMGCSSGHVDRIHLDARDRPYVTALEATMRADPDPTPKERATCIAQRWV